MRKHGRGHDKTGRSDRDQRHIRLEHWLLDTPAALSLSGTAFKVLIYMAKRFDGFNNGKIGFACRSGSVVRDRGTGRRKPVSIGIGKSMMSKALAELEAAGFIRVMKDSTFDQKRMAREWRLTWLPCKDQAPTNEFAKISLEIARAKRSPILRTERDLLVHSDGQQGAQQHGNGGQQSTQRDYGAVQ